METAETGHKRESFQKFWTKDKTEALLRILANQADAGDIHHGKAAKLLSDELQLQNELQADQIVDRISLLVASFKKEIEKEERNGLPSQWRWKKQMTRLTEKVTAGKIHNFGKIQSKIKRSRLSIENLEPPVKKLCMPITQREVKIASGTDSDGATGERFIEASRLDFNADLDKKKDAGLSLLNGPERRGRMPDQHVEVLLDCYKFVLQNRMLSSGRLGKGSFQEVADEMNKRCSLAGDSVYEREQLAAKLQNLKTQYRNRKQAVDDGRESGSLWKWYQIMEDLSQAELMLRESFESSTATRIHPTYQSSPATISIPDEDIYTNAKEEEKIDISLDIQDRKNKRDLTYHELEQSFGDLAMLLMTKDDETVSTEDLGEAFTHELSSMRSTALRLVMGLSAVINHVNSE